MKKILLAFLILCVCLSSVITVSAKTDYVKIILNGQSVTFTDDSGFPYVDANNRTMVPLRVTMEAAGFVVGYDSNKHTAIVICDKARIEVPIGTNKVYCNNNLIENDTVSVVNNGRTYLPIRAILEAAGYNVEWDGNANAVKATTSKIDDYTEMTNTGKLVPYSTSNLGTLVNALLSGKVVYINGQYYATPEYVAMLKNEVIVYNNDVSDSVNVAKYPQKSRFDLAELDTSEFDLSSSDDSVQDLDGIGETSKENTEPENKEEWISSDLLSETHYLASEKYGSNYFFFDYIFDVNTRRHRFGFYKKDSKDGEMKDIYYLENVPLDWFFEEQVISGIRTKGISSHKFQFYKADLIDKGLMPAN